MPYVDIVSSDDFVSLWYITNSPYNNVGSFDTAKPTIILLHPLFLSVQWLNDLFNDFRLDSAYNMVAFDMRVCGKSKCRPSALHDSWVDAADIAYAHKALQLPPCHIIAVENLSVNCALRLEILFPELCTSLTLCNVPPPSELKWVFSAYDEVLQAWCFAEDLDSFEHAGKEAAQWLAGSDCDLDLLDELVAYWETTFPPFRRLRLMEMMSVIMNRCPITAKELAEIRKPVLIIQGEQNPICPLKYAEQLADSLINAERPEFGELLFVVKGASTSLTIVPSNSSIVNRVISQFLSRQDRTGSPLIPASVHVHERMRTALSRLASIAGDPSIAKRDPSSPLSFSCVTPEVQKSQLEALQFYVKDLDKAFSPLDAHGRPHRKYSDGRKEHWFHAERDGMSCADSELVREHQRRHEEYIGAEASHITLSMLPTSEIPSTQLTENARVRRAEINVASVDKQVIRGSMSKIANSAGLPIQLSKLASPSPAVPLSRLHL